MNTFDSLPPRNPDGESYTCDDVKLRRDHVPPSVTSGAFGEAWELVKKKPVETLLLSFLWLMFNGNGSCNMPSGGGGSSSGSDRGGTDSWEQSSDFGGALFESAADLVGAITGFEVALIGGIMAAIMMMATIMLVLGTLVRGGANIYWLRLIRGQDASLNHTTDVIRFFVPLFVVSLLSGIAIVFGGLLLIVPGVILAMGFFFVTQVAIDKNIGYMEGLKASWRITQGHKLDLFIFAILCGLLNFAGLLACCVGLIATNAVVMGATAIIYDRIAEPGNAYLAPGELEQVVENEREGPPSHW